MGYALPSGVLNTNSLCLYPVNPVVALGPYVKQVADQTLVVLDYSALTPAVTLTDYAFAVDVSTNPQLVIAFPSIDETGETLSFLLSGGIVEQQYKITVNVNAGAREDVLVINIPSSGKAIQPVPSIYNQLPLWGGGYVNSAVRAFWGAVPPSNPNVMDQWFDTANGLLYEWMTDGETAQWFAIYNPNYLFEAPHDGVLYGRLNSTWTPVPISEILFDAPSDGAFYARQNHLWAAVPRIPQASDALPLMDAPVPLPGTDTSFARSDHTHPTDSTLYSASNPAGYQTAGDVSVTLGDYMPLSGGGFSGAVSFQTAALFASPTNIQVGGGNPNYVLSTDGAGALSWVPPTVGISDAPIDTQTYARNHGNWVNITTATGVPEAPSDGQLWARENLTWVTVPIGGGAGIADSPNDSTTYARRNTGGVGAWQHLTHTDITDWNATLAPYALITNLPQPSGITPLMNGTGAIGTSVTYARADHAHPSDTSRYAASNPANYIPEAPNNGGGYVRRNLGWSFPTHNDISDWATATIPVTVSATAPGGATSSFGVAPPQTGWLWFKTTDQQLYVYTGTAWVITVSPPIIPEAPNDGNAYARKSLGWSRLTHNDIADWSATLGAYLPLSGGTLTGGLTVPYLASTTNMDVTGTIGVHGTGAGAGSYTGYFDGPTTRKGYIGQFTQGMVWASDPAATNITLHTNGNIYLNGSTQATTITATGVIHSNSDITAGGNMSCGTISAQLSTGGTVTAGALHSTGNSQIDGSEQVNGNFNCSNTVAGYTGNFSYSTIYGNQQINGSSTVNGNVVAGYLQSNGTAYVASTLTVNGTTNAQFVNCVGIYSNGDVNAQGNAFSHGAYYCDAAGGGFFHRDTAGNMGMQIYCNTGNNLATWVNNRTGQSLIMSKSGAANQFIINSDQAIKPTAGSWLSSSDKRIKDVLGRYKAGLKEVLLLQPVEFTFKGNDTNTEDGVSIRAELAKDKTKVVGYVADDIMQVLPETVTLQRGYIDGKEVDDLKYLDITNVTHALVNAMKEMYAEVQSLRAEVQALKAAA